MAIGIGPFEFAVDVLLELLHVEELERFLRLQEAVGQLQDVVAHGVLLDGVLHVDGGLAEPLDQDVPGLVHLDLASLADGSLELLCFGVSHWIIEAVDSDPGKEEGEIMVNSPVGGKRK